MAFPALLETLLVSPAPIPGLVFIAGLGLEPRQSTRAGANGRGGVLSRVYKTVTRLAAIYQALKSLIPWTFMEHLLYAGEGVPL